MRRAHPSLLLSRALPTSLALAPLALVLPGAGRAHVQDAPPPRGLEAWPAVAAEAQLAREERIVEAIDPERLAEWHELTASVPHVAGSAGDQQVIGALVEAFGSFGLEVEVQPFEAYLARPVSARLELLSPAQVELSLEEQRLPDASPYSASDELDFGWNAYSGSGVAEGEVVYANYGRKEDFEALRERGVDCTGKIVVARYGGNFRGYKAKYAEAAGAAGLVIFTDPKDSGFGRGVVWPEGGWANDTCIQRGSILTLPWIGDPLTPGIPATPDAERLDPDSLPLPKIPVQPIGWASALQILGPMKGMSAPQGWQGGLPLRYRLTGGPEVRVRLEVRQERGLVRTANVLAHLRGKDAGERGAPLGPRVIVGCHHDAWGYGASDPTCGLIGVLEAARVLSAEAREHGAPSRTITFAAWGAEEFGIVGSAEYVEAHREELIRDAELYVNLDAAANGLRFSSAATPEARRLVAGALARVPQPVAREDGGVGFEGTVLETWSPDAAADAMALPPFGELGGGSDHAPFIALAAVPSVNLSAGGAPGTAYHSIYDDLAWYRRTVGPDYESARLIARVAAVTASRAAEAPCTWHDPGEAVRAVRGHLLALYEDHEDFFKDAPQATGAWLRLTQDVNELLPRLAAIDTARRSDIDVEEAAQLSDELSRAARVWLDEDGLPGRQWFKNLYVAPDETSGYASWPLPGLRKAIELGEANLARGEIFRLREAILRLGEIASRIEDALKSPPGASQDR